MPKTLPVFYLEQYKNSDVKQAEVTDQFELQIQLMNESNYSSAKEIQLADIKLWQKFILQQEKECKKIIADKEQIFATLKQQKKIIDGIDITKDLDELAIAKIHFIKIFQVRLLNYLK